MHPDRGIVNVRIAAVLIIEPRWRFDAWNHGTQLAIGCNAFSEKSQTTVGDESYTSYPIVCIVIAKSSALFSELRKVIIVKLQPGTVCFPKFVFL